MNITKWNDYKQGEVNCYRWKLGEIYETIEYARDRTIVEINGYPHVVCGEWLKITYMVCEDSDKIIDKKLATEIEVYNHKLKNSELTMEEKAADAIVDTIRRLWHKIRI